MQTQPVRPNWAWQGALELAGATWARVISPWNSWSGILRCHTAPCSCAELNCYHFLPTSPSFARGQLGPLPSAELSCFPPGNLPCTEPWELQSNSSVLFDPYFLLWAEESDSLITRLPRPWTWRNINVSVTLITLLAFKPTGISHRLQWGLRWVMPGSSGCKTQRRFCHQRLTQNHSRGRSKVSTRAHMSRFPN